MATGILLFALTRCDFSFLALARYALIGLVAWRFWRFSICPWLRPDSPKELPYWIPFVGHAVSMLRSPHAVVSAGIEYCKGSGEPISINVMGQTIYFILSEQDVTAVLREHPELTHAEHIQDLLRGLGCSQHGIQQVDQPVGSDSKLPPLVHVAENLMQKQLLNMELGGGILARTLEGIDARTQWDGIDPSAVLGTSADGKRKTVSLFKWTLHALIESITTAWFGSAIWRLSPSIVEDMASLDHDLWRLLFRLPEPFVKDVQAARERLRRCLVEYIRLPPSKKQDQSWAIRSSEEEMRIRGLSEDDMACYLLMVFWATNANAFKLIFWLLAHVCSNPSLLKSTVSEIDTIFADHAKADPSSTSPSSSLLSSPLSIRLERSPSLEALYNETHRITINSSSARTVTRTVTINGTTYSAGAHIILPFRHLAQSHPVLGADWDVFRPERFMEDRALGRSRSFLPFGGGKHKCFGRFLTRRIVLGFAGLVLRRFEVGLVEGESVPEMNFMRTMAGPSEVVEGGDLRVEIGLRSLVN